MDENAKRYFRLMLQLLAHVNIIVLDSPVPQGRDEHMLLILGLDLLGERLVAKYQGDDFWEELRVQGINYRFAHSQREAMATLNMSWEEAFHLAEATLSGKMRDLLNTSAPFSAWAEHITDNRGAVHDQTRTVIMTNLILCTQLYLRFEACRPLPVRQFESCDLTPQVAYA